MLHPLRWAGRIVTAIVLAALVYYAVSAVQVLTASRAPGAVAAAPHEPAAIVLGVGAETRRGISGRMESRLAHVRQLWTAHHVGRIVVCASSRGRAVLDKDWLVRHGVNSADISFVFAHELPGQLHLVSAHLPYARRSLVVADGWQTLWVTHVASSAGLTVVPSPVTPQVSTLAKAGEVLQQGAAVAWGRIVGFGQTGFIAG